MKLYHALLWLYPASFRAEYGGEMRVIFARRWRQRPDLGSRVRLSLEAVGDVLKRSLAPEALVPGIRAIVARADPEQSISDIQLLTDIVGAETAPRQVQVRVLGGFAVIAFLLAGIGLHGLLA